ncbi:MAG: hypothetical protein QOG43_692 [Actinomycetota bacterium]|jgi:hypothetical protein|nr:hypothetical protein [Actinomycetota bacterium]
MRRSRLRALSDRAGRTHYEVAAVISVLGLVVLGRPLLAGGQAADGALTLPATAGLLAAAPPAPDAPSGDAPAGLTALPAPSPPSADDPMAWFAPGGRNQGTENLALALADIALADNPPLYISDGWGRTWGSSTSDHSISRTDSWAVDLAVRGIQRPTAQTEEAARRVAAALGHPDWTGGDLKVTINGYRFQVLWKVSGHFNHVHVGVRKV